jgi:hypothetical protein
VSTSAANCQKKRQLKNPRVEREPKTARKKVAAWNLPGAVKDWQQAGVAEITVAYLPAQNEILGVNENP